MLSIREVSTSEVLTNILVLASQVGVMRWVTPITIAKKSKKVIIITIFLLSRISQIFKNSMANLYKAF
jgi:hypothetical protein